MTFQHVWKLVAMPLGLAMVSVASTYYANANASLMAYVAAACMSVGTYLVGLYTVKPTNGEQPK